MKWPFEDSSGSAQETGAWEMGLPSGRCFYTSWRFSCGKNTGAFLDFPPPFSAKEVSLIDMGFALPFHQLQGGRIACCGERDSVDTQKVLRWAGQEQSSLD